MEPRSTTPDWDATRECLVALGFVDPEPLAQVGADAGAYSPAGRWQVGFGDGSRAFVKAMEARPLPGHGLRREQAVYASGSVGSCATLLGWSEGSEGGRPDVLVIEDLSGAKWGAPVSDDDARALAVGLAQVAAAPVADVLPALPAEGVWPGTGWHLLHTHVGVLAQVGVFDDAWFEAHAATLVAAAAAIEVDGEALVHCDLWLQNWCRTPAGAVIVDWSGASRGNSDLNLAWGECGIRAARGPAGIVLPPSHPLHDAWAAWMSGVALGFLAQDHQWRDQRPRLHATQLREALAALAWTCDALDVPAPDNAATLAAVGAWEP